MSTYFGKGIMYSKDVYSRIAVDISCIGARREVPASRTTVRVLCLGVDKSQSSDEERTAHVENEAANGEKGPKRASSEGEKA